MFTFSIGVGLVLSLESRPYPFTSSNKPKALKHVTGIGLVLSLESRPYPLHFFTYQQNMKNRPPDSVGVPPIPPGAMGPLGGSYRQFSNLKFDESSNLPHETDQNANLPISQEIPNTKKHVNHISNAASSHSGGDHKIEPESRPNIFASSNSFSIFSKRQNYVHFFKFEVFLYVFYSFIKNNKEKISN